MGARGLYNRVVATSVEPVETAFIPAGAFMMGDDDGRPDERPAHRVMLSAFRMAVLPVTNREYAAFLAATGHELPRFWNDAAFNHPRQPVVGVSWSDAAAYCEWLSSAHGGAWRHAVKVSRCAARSSIPPDYRYNDYGFRVVVEV